MDISDSNALGTATILRVVVVFEVVKFRGIRIQRHAFMHLACLVSSVAVLG